jgi:CubicO group peptidase (beta-lactamase class C family)
MQLVEAGKIDLDAPVTKYLPWFRAADQAASARITVRRLLNQDSGLPVYEGLEGLSENDQSGPPLHDGAKTQVFSDSAVYLARLEREERHRRALTPA